MSEPEFTCLGVRADAQAASPTLTFRLRVSDPASEGVHAMALRCQIRIEPRRRPYTPEESALLTDLFGDSSRWGETQQPMQFAQTSVMVPGFTGSTEVDMSVPCSYDLEVAAGKYFASLDTGDVPLLLLFSGTVFARTEFARTSAGGLTVRMVPWHCEARCGLPVAVWRELMDLWFPGSGWLRLRRDTLRALQLYKSTHGIATWDETVDRLLKEASG
ncbi:hypothetical protein SAMN05421505_13241 [Sinosporangium album]|uniref:Uncharacterized protein n=1 Tax=Sinosporangium album TaxID=504805 RepID=A0A1G8HIN2_9ACTN|nr:DUF6084 family protein [Sinosporangium album]SDI06310.1 hypothetical protein SAMN05421505_13241 [Sinosporangium album]